MRGAMDAVRAIEHAELAHDWLAAIAEAGSANHGLAQWQRREHAMADLRDVERCDLLWLLAPETITRGAWAELGAASVLRKRIIVSGVYDQSIFCALAHVELRTDVAALEYIRSWSAPSGDAGDHYTDHRAESSAWATELRMAVERNASAEEIRLLEQRLEMARYVGD